MKNLLQGAKVTHKLRSILSGWKNYAFASESIEKLAKVRAVECAKCPFSVKGLHDVIIDDRIQEIEGMLCNNCSCPLSSKLRSKEEKCPMGKW